MKRSLKKKKFRKTLADRFKESEMYKNAEIDSVIGEQAIERRSIKQLEEEVDQIENEIEQLEKEVEQFAKEWGFNYGFPSKEEADLWMNSKPVGEEKI